MKRPHTGPLTSLPYSESPWPAPPLVPTARAPIAKLIGIVAVMGLLAAGYCFPYAGGLGLAANHEASKFLDQPVQPDRDPTTAEDHPVRADGHTVIAELFQEDRQPRPAQ